MPKKFKTIVDEYGDGPETFMKMAALAKEELQKRKNLFFGEK